MWCVAATETMDREMLVKKHFQDAWRVYHDPAIIIGNIKAILQSPAVAGLGAAPIDPKVKEELEKVIPLVNQLREKAQPKEMISTGG